jgi:hypothetical protein
VRLRNSIQDGIKDIMNIQSSKKTSDSSIYHYLKILELP